MAVLALTAAQPAHATQFFIDEFAIVKNGAAFFDDTFNGTAPPGAPNFSNGSPGAYAVMGAFTNVGHKVLIDTAQGQLTTSAVGAGAQTFSQALLQSNISSNITLGLRSTNTFSVTGLFDLVMPGPMIEAYGIRLADFTPTDRGDDIVDLLVERLLDGNVYIAFAHKNFITGELIFPGIASLDPAHAEIALTLTKLDANSPLVTASYAYVDGGVLGPITTFSNTANAFTDENFTRGAFIAFSPVPEPSSLLLVTAGLIGIGALRHRWTPPGSKVEH